MDNIRAGFWQNYGTQGPQAIQYLVTEKTAILISNTIAVTFTLALPRIFILLKRFAPEVRKYYDRLVRTSVLCWCHRTLKKSTYIFRKVFAQETPIDASRETYSLETIAEDNQERRILTGVLRTIQDSRTAEDAASRLVRQHLAMPQLLVGAGSRNLRGLYRILRNIVEEPKSAGLIFILVLIFFAVFIGLQVIAISSGFIIGDSIAHIQKGSCAYYVISGNCGGGVDYIRWFSGHHNHHSLLTESALDYKAAFYDIDNSKYSFTPALTASTHAIPHNTRVENSCPFLDRGMCKYKNNTALVMDTEFLSARLLGINSPRQFEFRRQTSCSPIVDTEKYIRIQNISDDILEVEYHYWNNQLGGVIDGWRERRNRDYNDWILHGSAVNFLAPDVHLSKAYNVRIFQDPISQRNGGDINYPLLPGLLQPFAATSLFFVSKGGLRYYAKSEDPVFPAQTKTYSSWPSESRWAHLGLKRKVFGCVDKKYVRDQDLKREWFFVDGRLHDTASNDSWAIIPPAQGIRNWMPYSKKEFSALQLLCLAMRFSDTASAVRYARSKWLNADTRVIEGEEGAMSLPLDPKQWQVESHNLFNISLARMQTEILEMTRPIPKRPEDCLRNWFDNEADDPCSLIMVKAQGWRNISVVGLAGMLGLAISLWLLTMDTGDSIVLLWLLRRFVHPLVLWLVSSVRSAWEIVYEMLLSLRRLTKKWWNSTF